MQALEEAEEHDARAALILPLSSPPLSPRGAELNRLQKELSVLRLVARLPSPAPVCLSVCLSVCPLYTGQLRRHCPLTMTHMHVIRE